MALEGSEQKAISIQGNDLIERNILPLCQERGRSAEQELDRKESIGPSEPLIFASCAMDTNPDRASWTEAQYFQLKAQIAAYKYVIRGLPIPPHILQALNPPLPESWVAQRKAIQQATYNIYKYKYEGGEMVLINSL